MVASAIVFAWWFPLANGQGIGWVALTTILLLAIGGEVLEFATGAAGAAKQGASRRSVALSVVGAMIGSIVGSFVGLPVPVVGSLVAALLGGAGGAFVGAYLGEHWTGATPQQKFLVGRSAFNGRLLGTAGKLVVGTLLFVVITMATFF